MQIWSCLFLQIFCSLDTSILLQLSNWLISWGTSQICMVVVECCQLVSLRLFPNNPTSSSDCVSINLLWWSCQVCWLSTVLGYLMGSCICLKFESTYAMATGSRIRKWCHPRLTLEATMVAFLCLCDFQILLLLEGLLLFLILWWVWAANVIHGAEYFSYKAKGNDCRAMVRGFLTFWIQNRIRLRILLVLLSLFWDWIDDFLGPWNSFLQPLLSSWNRIKAFWDKDFVVQWSPLWCPTCCVEMSSCLMLGEILSPPVLGELSFFLFWEVILCPSGTVELGW